MLGSVPLEPRPDYDSPSALKALLEAESLAMSKRFGQNFLVNPGARARILAELGEPEGPGPVWEIGPGLGAMTALALDSGFSVLAFEIDHGFVRLLKRVFGDESGFALVEGDFLDTWKRARSERGEPSAIFGNLPYSAASAMIAALIEGDCLPGRMVFTLQKEAALRMAAKPGTKDYSAFSVLCAAACEVRIAFDLGAASFWPQPRVVSSVVRLRPRPDPLCPDDRLGFSRFVRSAFASRRKTLRNNLTAVGRDDTLLRAVLDKLGIRQDIRAEALTPSRLAEVYQALDKR